MSYFFATLLLPDDVPGHVDFGGSHSEAAAARIALRASNQMRHDTCVATHVKDGVEVRQVIRWKGLAVVEPEIIPDPTHKQLGFVPLLEALDAARVWCDGGYTVTISPSSAAPTMFNVIGRK